MDRRSGFGLVGAISGLILALLGEIVAYELSIASVRQLFGDWLISILSSIDLSPGFALVLIGIILFWTSLYIRVRGKSKQGTRNSS